MSQHHERADGSGYPQRLSGESIGLSARVVALADVYDAMTSDRPYHPATPPAEAVRWILQHAGRRFDAELDRAFTRAIGMYPVGSLVRLNTGELAIVAAVHPTRVRRPSVLLVTTPGGAALPGMEWLDLAAPLPSAARREIVSTVDARRVAPLVERCLAAPAVPAAELPCLDARV